jgi:hypothetical protein
MSSWQVFRDRPPKVNSGYQPGDYVPPPHDETKTKIRVERPCRLKMSGDQEPIEFAAGSIVSLPQWLALEAVAAGRCTLVK